MSVTETAFKDVTEILAVVRNTFITHNNITLTGSCSMTVSLSMLWTNYWHWTALILYIQQFLNPHIKFKILKLDYITPQNCTQSNGLDIKIAIARLLRHLIQWEMFTMCHIYKQVHIPTGDYAMYAHRSNKWITTYQTKCLTEISFLNVTESSVTNFKIKTVNYWHSVDWYPYLEVLEAITNFKILECSSSEEN
jgi:hypothetical protein